MIRTDQPVYLGAMDVAAIVPTLEAVRDGAKNLPNDLYFETLARAMERILRVIEHAQRPDYTASVIERTIQAEQDMGDVV